VGEELKEFGIKLKAEAKAKSDAAKKPQVQVPAGPTPQARPAQAPSRPAASAQQPPKPPATAANRDDATPPPTRNPLLARKPVESARETGDEDSHQQEGSVEVSEEVMEEEAGDPNSTAIKPNPLNAGRKPAPAAAPASGARPPVKPPPPRR
jgi:hypothetical protein